jgi:hypothetical protein
MGHKLDETKNKLDELLDESIENLRSVDFDDELIESYRVLEQRFKVLLDNYRVFSKLKEVKRNG